MYVRGKAFCFKPLKIKDLVRGNHLGSLKGPNIIVSTNSAGTAYMNKQNCYGNLECMWFLPLNLYPVTLHPKRTQDLQFTALVAGAQGELYRQPEFWVLLAPLLPLWGLQLPLPTALAARCAWSHWQCPQKLLLIITSVQLGTARWPPQPQSSHG